MAAGTLDRTASWRNVATRFLVLNWGILLILVAWEGWVAANDFNPIVMPSPQGVAVDMVSNPGVYIENTSVTLFVAPSRSDSWRSGLSAAVRRFRRRPPFWNHGAAR